MSTVTRIISGSVANWARILVTILSQVILVPLYLTYWDISTLGVWAALQGIIALLTTLDFGHQTYLEFEFLKIGQYDLKELRRSMWSGAMVSLLIGIFQVVIIIVIIYKGWLVNLIGNKSEIRSDLMEDANMVLLMNGIVWLVCYSVSGIFGRALATFGYYPRTAWWNVCLSLIYAITASVAIVFKASFLMTNCIASLITILTAVGFYIDLIRLLYREGLQYQIPSLKYGWRNFFLSIGLSGKLLLDNFRQQGIRVLLAPIVSMSNLAAFTTMRTGANFAIQGLGTITNPLMPEVIRFLHHKNQEKCEAAFGMVWIVLVTLLAPGVVVLQFFIEPIFNFWTKGKVVVDPLLFGILSLSVIIYAWAQPSIAIIRGNNLLKSQLYISIVSALVLSISIFWLVSYFEILGAGIALLFTEVTIALLSWYAAKQWMNLQGLAWPNQSKIALASVVVCGISMIAMCLWSQESTSIAIFAIFALLIISYVFWYELPASAKSKFQLLITRSSSILTSNFDQSSEK